MKKAIGIIILGLLWCDISFAGKSYIGRNKDVLYEGISKIQFCKKEFPTVFAGGACRKKSKYFRDGIEVNTYGGESIMMNSTLANGNFPESSFYRANLYEANLEGGNFEKTNFESANLTRVNFKGSSLVEAVFKNSNLFESDFTGANILNASFEGANLNNATWVDGKKCALGSIGACKTE